jgi:hypothetical protein
MSSEESGAMIPPIRLQARERHVSARASAIPTVRAPTRARGAVENAIIRFERKDFSRLASYYPNAAIVPHHNRRAPDPYGVSRKRGSAWSRVTFDPAGHASLEGAVSAGRTRLAAQNYVRIRILSPIRRVLQCPRVARDLQAGVNRSDFMLARDFGDRSGRSRPNDGSGGGYVRFPAQAASA